MDENLLLIAFAVFGVLVLIVALVLRKMTVDDIFSDDKASPMSASPFPDRVKDTLPAAPKNTLAPAGAPRSGIDTPTFALNRQTINKIGKILSAVGTIMIIAPLSSSWDGVAFGILFVGYLLARFTNPPKEQKTGTVQSSNVDMLRKLASKPEYREAMQILAADMRNNQLQTDADRRQRAIRYLQSKGVSVEEATRNVGLMAAYIAQQQKK